MKCLVALSIFFLFSSAAVAAEKPAAQVTGEFGAYAPSGGWTPPTDPAVVRKLEQWQGLKFGLLISWQACSQWGNDSWVLSPERFKWNQRMDWSTGQMVASAGDNLAYKKEYENLITTFNPVKFDPRRWADAAQQAGVKYVLVMSKHCDGFSMYDTKSSEYKITSTRCPFHTNPQADVLKAQAEAFHAVGIHVGMYASKCDWAHPDYWAPDFPLNTRGANYKTREHPERWARYKKFFRDQIEELMTGYGPIDILWLDDGWVQPAKGEDLDISGVAAMARTHQPGLIVVDRTVRGPNENYVTPEQTIPGKYLPYPWETCMTLGDHWNWFPNDKFKSAGTIIRNLCRIVARNGNYVVGIGPGPDGEFDPAVYQRLEQIGAWLKVNGEAIYDTRPLEPYDQGNCVFTRREDGCMYAIILSGKDNDDLPASVKLPEEIAQRVTKAALLSGGALTVTDGTLVVPAALRNNSRGACAWGVRLEP